MKQPAPFLISRKRIRSIRITRSGWAFIGLTVTLGLAGLNTGNNLLYLIFGMFLSMLLINGILSSNSLYNISLKLTLPQRLYAGSGNPLKLELTNQKTTFPSFVLTLAPKKTKEDIKKQTGFFFFRIPAQNTEQMVHYQSFPSRGIHPIPDFQLNTAYPFGLIEKHIPIRFNQEVTIYPQLFPLHRGLLSSTSLQGEFLSGSAGLGVNPYGVREYHYGDDIRHVHWRSFAKVSKWMVREYEQEKKSQVTIHLVTENTKPQTENGKKRREALVSFTASLLMYFVEEDRAINLMINNQLMQPGDSGYIDYYLTILALFDDERGQTYMANGSDKKPQGTVITFSERAQSDVGHFYGDIFLFPDDLELPA